MMQTHDILKRARKLIEKPENWTRGNYATTKDGRRADFMQDNAECFCMVGAVKRVCHEAQESTYFALARLSRCVPRTGRYPENEIVSFNDSPETEHRHVLQVFDMAINTQTG